MKGKMVNEITNFLEERQVAEPIRSAFLAYCKSLYASRYMFKANGDTVNIFLSRMTEEQVKQAWVEFSRDMMSTLPTILA